MQSPVSNFLPDQANSNRTMLQYIDSPRTCLRTDLGVVGFIMYDGLFIELIV